MQTRIVTMALAVGRVAIGTAAFVAPRRIGRGWLGSAADLRGTQIAIRAFAVRDVALGLGTLASLDDPVRTRNWVEAGIIADAGDAAATVMGRGSDAKLASLGVLAIAVGAVATGLRLREDLVGVAGVEPATSRV